MTDLTMLTQAELIALVQTMQAAPPKRITMKVGEKGGLSLYGLGRFPVSLYRSQWERLLSEKDAILAFIETNSALLTVKA